MNRNTLPIAIVVVAAIGITLGVLLPGVLPSGPLSGALSKQMTSLTLTATTIEDLGTGDHRVRLDGRLSTLDGTGIPGASVQLSQQISTTTIVLGTVTTGPEGSFTSTCVEPPGGEFVYFAGFYATAYYDSSQSDRVQRT